MSDEFTSGSSVPAAPDSGSVSPTPSPVGPEAGAPGQDYLEIKWNNRTERLPRDRAVEFAQKGYDYTQKMQDLARQRQEFEGQRQQYDRALNEVRAFLSDQAKVEQYLQALRQQGGQQQQAAGSDDELITAQQMQQQLQQQQQQLMGMTQQQLSAMRAQFEIDQLASRYTQDLDGHIKGITDQMPELRAIPRIQQILKEEVAEMGPRTLDEAKAFMIDVAKQHAQNVKNFFMEQRKQAVTQGSPLQSGIEPPAGSAPMPPSAGHFRKVSDPGFKDAVLNDFMRIQEKMASRG